MSQPPSSPPVDVRDRARGALLGLAIGDALGTTLEFSRRDTLPHHTEMTGGGPFQLQPGQWTDDTSMALALAESLLHAPDFDARDLMNRFVAWFRCGAYSCTNSCFDVGMTTESALKKFERTGDPISGATDPDSAGNGSLMRLAPVALHTLHDIAEAERIAGEQSRTTHGAPQAIEACSYFVQLLREAILGQPDVLRSRARIGTDSDGLRPRHLTEGLDFDLTPQVRTSDAAIDAIARGSWRTKTRDQIRSSGYVIHTLEAALWAVGTTDSFEAALTLAVNLGDDADTVGAVTGQLAGALYGASAIPERWLHPLAWRDQLIDLADRLHSRDP
ncbi:ADP-ribosylglycohydrolase family protein [Methylobacterium sp. WL64]|uniref:ADP-ribosylglycohydrolase family protein n=1 Tax=Methylobacterium sp. WL64 TaxID=2603894 RepID=UPI0011CB6E50|nr:ADP-ribosylglycohydrolase family protein [Methylobacterium sp. WL64]TXN00179.1 ADP-ribosylglycohydrolase family protein [Methylobacterium sp. WL64]